MISDFKLYNQESQKYRKNVEQKYLTASEKINTSEIELLGLNKARIRSQNHTYL